MSYLHSGTKSMADHLRWLQVFLNKGKAASLLISVYSNIASDVKPHQRP